ncbi:MAG: capsular polysaccharide export protein, LipB/KpsS family [Candidatus Helarchaeota archaeon]
MKIISFISPDIEHRYIRKLGEECLDIEFTKNYDVIRNSDKPMIIWNPYGYLAYDKEPYKKKYEIYKEHLSKGKDVYVVERGALPNTIFIEKNTFNVESDSYNEDKWNFELDKQAEEEAIKYINWLRYDEHTLEPQQSSQILNEELFFQFLKVDRKKFKNVVFVPLQIHNDTVTLLWCDWVKSTNQFQNFIYLLSLENPETLFLIKNHPCEESSYYCNYKRDNIKIVDNYHYKDCLEYCDKVITINSGIGLQAMCWDKPVAICGQAFYHIDGVNLKINNLKELQSFIDIKWSVNFEKIKRFIYYLTNKFYTECTMQKISRNASVPKLIKTLRLPQDCYVKTKKRNKKLKILYLFNEYGWAFEFEAKNYAKYSTHNIVPFHYNPTDFQMHKLDYRRIINQNPDIIVLPSAWHYYKYKNEFFQKIQKQGIKIYVQYNSHYEPKYFCKHANLVLCSSQKIFDEVNFKFNYKNIQKQLHFVDTDRFYEMPLSKDCIVGWCGRFDNPVKRTQFLFRMSVPILVKANYHYFLKENRSHDEMVDFYKKINILLVTSEHEGTPMPLLEAMSCGRVVLSTDVGIASEVLPQWCVIKETEPEKIIEEFNFKLDKLINNTSLRNAIGKRNSEYIKHHLSWKNQVKQLDDLYIKFANEIPVENKLIYGDSTFRELLNYFNEQKIYFYLMNDTCLDAIRFCDLKLQPHSLYLGTDNQNYKQIKKLLKNHGWFEFENIFEKEGKRIILKSEYISKTKAMTLFGLDVQVPFPVIPYLEKYYGKNWRTYGIYN